MSLKNNVFLVTGGAGFIGSHLIERLLIGDNVIVCIDNLSSGFIKNLPNHKNLKVLKKAVQDVRLDQLPKFDGIFHLAAQASVPKSIDDFYNSSLNNLQSMLKVWEWANELKVPIVYASSSAVYGNLSIGDDMVDKYDILSPYAQDKLTMEHYAKMAWKVYQTSSIGLRFFNVYGPRQDPTNPYSGVISIFIDRLKNNLPVTVNGGYQTRDFIYVIDVVECLEESMSLLQKKALCETLNVGTGKSVTIDRLLEILVEIMYVKPKVLKAKLPFGDPEISGGTYEKMKEILKVYPSNFTCLLKGLGETVSF